MFEKYLVLIILGLITLKFFIELFNEKINIDLNHILFKASISLIFTIITFGYIYDYFFEKIEFITEYTIIPVYLIFHLLIECILCMGIIFILLIIIEIINGLRGSVTLIGDIIKGLLGDFIKIRNFFYGILKYLNESINPLYTVDLKNINIIKSIKIIFVINYLVAGLVMISPMTNYINETMEESYLNTSTYDNFKRDYELYKSVFIMSLIPFSINYIFKKEDYKNKKNRELNVNYSVDREDKARLGS